MEQVAEKTKNKKSTALAHSFSKDQYLEWYKLMVRIRTFEVRAGRIYKEEQKIRGFCHLYDGQEAVAAGITSATRQLDPLITAYRQHGNAVAKGISMKACMAELYGKETGCVKGKGGSMHFFSKEHAYFGGHGIVGAQIGMGAGLAFAEKYKGTDNVCITMFGDGAARQGILHEAFNMAMTWKLPVVFICENNFYAMGTSIQRTSNVVDIYKFGLAYDMPSFQVNGMRCEDVHLAVHDAVQRARQGEGPTLLEIRTYRYNGHSISDSGLYRTKEEVNRYRELDPISAVAHHILDKNWATEDELEAIRNAAAAEVDEAVQFAEESDFQSGELLYEDNYVQPDYPFLKE
jgi:pyruvate dehydrogenase E1 component alpha subunit